MPSGAVARRAGEGGAPRLSRPPREHDPPPAGAPYPNIGRMYLLTRMPAIAAGQP